VGDPLMRRRLLAGAGALLLVLLAVLVWPVGLLTGDDDDSASTASEPAATKQTQTSGQPAASQGPAGIAVVVEQNGKKQLLVQAANLTPSGQSEGYYVWLYNSPDDARSLGGQVTDQQGSYQALGAFPADYKKYKFIDVTRQQVGDDPNIKHSGESVLRGPMPTIKKSTAKPGKAAAVGQTVLEPPSS
jgi:hypothetical protein